LREREDQRKQHPHHFSLPQYPRLERGTPS
jgi:hypothetical protein